MACVQAQNITVLQGKHLWVAKTSGSEAQAAQDQPVHSTAVKLMFVVYCWCSYSQHAMQLSRADSQSCICYSMSCMHSLQNLQHTATAQLIMCYTAGTAGTAGTGGSKQVPLC